MCYVLSVSAFAAVAARTLSPLSAEIAIDIAGSPLTADDEYSPFDEEN
jgi:hypothetical protein